MAKRKTTPAAARAAADAGQSPLEHLLEVMRDAGQAPAARLSAAKAAAPYVHPRLAAHVVAPEGSDALAWLRAMTRQGPGIAGLFGGDAGDDAEEGAAAAD